MNRKSLATAILFLHACLFATVVARTEPPASQPAPASAPLTFEVTFDAAICDHAYTGRVWVMTSRSANREPRFGPDWFHPAPFFASPLWPRLLSAILAGSAACGRRWKQLR